MPTSLIFSTLMVCLSPRQSEICL